MRNFLTVFGVIFIFCTFIFIRYASNLDQVSGFSRAINIYEIHSLNTYVYRYSNDD
jgi:hypothetical protein